jgi:hypothetical protein
MWFGGGNLTQTAFLTQTFTIPVGALAIDFYLWMVPQDGNLTLSVKLDGTELFVATQDDAPNYAAYTLVSINVSGFADGNSHVLRFDYSDAFNFLSDGPNLHLDDVTLRMGAGGGNPVPEPGTWALAAGALLLMGSARRALERR